MGVTAVFIDGGYLDKVLYREHANARIDFEKLSKLMAGSDELLRPYYYHCMPYQGNPPTPEESARYASRHRFTTRLSLLPRFEVRLGRLVCRGVDRNTGERIFQQKRVDCMIGVDMAILAGKGKITNAALFTGDSDLMPAVESVRVIGRRDPRRVERWRHQGAREPARMLCHDLHASARVVLRGGVCLHRRGAQQFGSTGRALFCDIWSDYLLSK